MTATRPAAPAIRRRWIAVLWCAGAVFEASQAVVSRHIEGKHLEEIPLFLTEFATWLPGLLAIPFVIGLARRYQIRRGLSLRGGAAHLLTWVILSMTVGAWSAGLHVLFNPWGFPRPPVFWETLSAALFFQALNSLAAYVLILTIISLVDARNVVARHAAETAHLNAELSKAQLTALRQQMEPHVMFNTLNSIAALVRDNRNTAAVNMIVGLSEFLRRALADAHRSEVTLAEEVEYLARYVDIQKLRFGDRLQVAIDIPMDLQSARAPYLLLQPLVENAIKHGVSQQLAGGRVSIAAVREGDTLRLRVHNDGPSPTDEELTRVGVGLGNLKTRLEILYGGDADLQLVRAECGGVEVAVTLPYATA